MNNMQKIKFVLVAPCYKRCLAARSDAGIKIAFLRVYTVICNDIMKEKSFWTVFHQLFPVSTGFTDYLFVLMRTWKLVFHFFILNVCRGLNGTLSIQSLSEGICGCGILESLFSLICQPVTFLERIASSSIVFLWIIMFVQLGCHSDT